MKYYSKAMFKKLNQTEASEFRQWARDNYKPFSPIPSLWHRETRWECRKINTEQNSEAFKAAARAALALAGVESTDRFTVNVTISKTACP
jgi:hypothetical protein